MFASSRLAFGVFSSILVLVGACQHPCQVHPEMCPRISVTVTTQQSTNYPGLIQLHATGSVLALKVTTQSDFSIDTIGELKASICPNADTCSDDCPGGFKIDPLPPPVVAADKSSRTYSIPATMLEGMPLGRGKVCITGAAFASSDVFAINRLLVAEDSSSSMLRMSEPPADYKPISFDLGKDDSGNWLALILGESGTYRNVFSYKYSNNKIISTNPNGSPLQIGPTATNESMQAVNVMSDSFLFCKSENKNPYIVSWCPLKNDYSSCTEIAAKRDDWTALETVKINATAGDPTSNHFIISLDSGTKSLKAYSTPYGINKMLTQVWESDGPLGEIALATAKLQSESKRSDVIAVTKALTNSANADSRDVRVFTATTDETWSFNENYSKGLRKAITAALRTSRKLIALASGDLDGDGLSEMVLLADNPSQVVILFNLGNGAFRVAGADFNDEATLLTLTTQSNALDVKVGNLDPMNPLSQMRIFVLAPTQMLTMTGTKDAALLQVISLK